MSVSNVNSTVHGAGQLGWRSKVREAGQDFNQLFQTMQAGKLSDAQQAYAALAQLAGTAAAPATGTTANDATSSAAAGGVDVTGTAAAAAAASSTVAAAASSAATASNPVAGDWSALGQALQSGDMGAAKTAFSQLEQDLQKAAQGMHHRHHAMDQARAVYSAMQIGDAAAGASATAGSGQGSLASDIGALRQALQSGDNTGAQKLLTQLEADLQSSGSVMRGRRHAHAHGFAQNPAAGYAAATTAPSTPTASATA